MSVFIGFTYWVLLLALVVDKRSMFIVSRVTTVYLILCHMFITSLDLSLQQAVTLAFALLWVRLTEFERLL